MIRAQNTRAAAVGAMVLFLPALGFADTATGGLEWEGVFETVVDSLTGPLAFGVAVVGMVATGAALIFGGEISGVLKSVIGVVFAACVMLLAGPVLRTLFPAAETLPSPPLPVSSAPVRPGLAATARTAGGRPEHGVITKTAHLPVPERGRAPCCG